MNVSLSEVLGIITESLKALNTERAPDEQIPISEETVLLGDGADLDSLGFVTFMADLEERLERAFGREFILAGELESPDKHPFRSVRALAHHIVEMGRAGSADHAAGPRPVAHG